MAEVYISPSLQEWNVGYGKYGTEEQRMNQLADIVQYELERHNVETYRNKPTMTLAEAVKDANSISPDLYVALHSNASNGKARGPEVYAHKFGGRGEELAKDIYDELKVTMPTEGLGVKEGYSTFDGKGMYELKRTTAPASLVEVGFHDNPDDAQFIIDNIYQLGNAISKGILKNLDIAYKEDTPERQALLKNRYNGISA